MKPVLRPSNLAADPPTLTPMQSWQRFTVVTASVLALHGAALWAVQAYKVRMDLVDKVPALVTRMLEPPKPLELKPPEPLSPPLPVPRSTPPPPEPKPVKAAPPPKTAPVPSPAPQRSAVPVAESPAPAPLPLATNNPNPAPNAPTGSATPAPATPPVAAAPPAAKAPTPAPALQLPTADVEHADNQYRAPYPKMSQRLGEEGRVVLRVMVGADGKPTGATVAKSSGSEHLDRAGIDTVMRWRFKPGTRGGTPEAMSVLQPVDFKLPS
jgi:periplasmic protein TonB